MNRMDDLAMFGQLIRMLDPETLRVHAARLHRAGYHEDLAIVRAEFQRRRTERSPRLLNAA